MGICGAVPICSIRNSTYPLPRRKKSDSVDQTDQSLSEMHHPQEWSHGPRRKIPSKDSNIGNLLPKISITRSEGKSEHVKRGFSGYSSFLTQQTVSRLKSDNGSLFSRNLYCENIHRVPKLMTMVDSIFIKSNLVQLSVFNDLAEENVEHIISKMFYCMTREGDYVFRQNDPASCLFIIDEGQCQVEVGESVKQKIYKGDKFGELALIYNAPRSASIKAVAASFFWALDRQTFRAVLADIAAQSYSSNRKFIDSIKFFDQFTKKQKDAITHSAITENFQPHQSIVRATNTANSFYMIRSGRVKCELGNEQSEELIAGDSFGEACLFSNWRWDNSVVALEPTTCLVFSRETLVKILGKDIKSMIKQNSILFAFEQNQLCSQLNQFQKMKLVNAIEEFQIASTQELEKRRHMPWFMIVVFEGSLRYGQQCFYNNQIFGTEFLLSKEKRQSLLRDNLIVDPGRYGRVSMKKVIEILGGDIESCIKKNEEMMREKEFDGNLISQSEQCQVNLEELVAIKTISRNARLNIFLVCDPKTEILYILKMIAKQNNGSLSDAMREKDILLRLRHPFIVSLHKVFEDESSVYSLTTFVTGIEMSDVIKNVKTFDNKTTRFYIGSLILALEYLHSKGVVHRDLRPDQMMVDGNGFVALVDFSSAKQISECRDRTNTITGMPHYMAPEVLLGKGYGYIVDLWSLGVIMYELMCGEVPFGEDEIDPVKIYHLILNSKHQFPPSFNIRKNYGAINLMNILLNKVPEARLCGDYAYLKSHAWFEDLNWDDLCARKLKPPYSSLSSHVLTPNELVKAKRKSISVHKEIKVD
jgi:cGMP-dependent protein kinase